MTNTYEYKQAFYKHINHGSIESAKVILPRVLQHFKVASVLDVGCGQGAWLSVWKDLGARQVVGIDGDYVSRESLLIDADDFRAADLRLPVRLNRKFDLVQSLEVAEHLPASAAETFVDSLVAHGEIVLFSAAVPGQGGENHINERPYSYWRDLFRRRGYVLLDLIRPHVRLTKSVEPWYRYNTFVFVDEGRYQKLSPETRKYQIADNAAVSDISPLVYKLRKLIVRSLPTQIVTRLAVLKKIEVVDSGR